MNNNRSFKSKMSGRVRDKQYLPKITVELDWNELNQKLNKDILKSKQNNSVSSSSSSEDEKSNKSDKMQYLSSKKNISNSKSPRGSVSKRRLSISKRSKYKFNTKIKSTYIKQPSRDKLNTRHISSSRKSMFSNRNSKQTPSVAILSVNASQLYSPKMTDKGVQAPSTFEKFTLSDHKNTTKDKDSPKISPKSKRRTKSRLKIKKIKLKKSAIKSHKFKRLANRKMIRENQSNSGSEIVE